MFDNEIQCMVRLSQELRRLANMPTGAASQYHYPSYAQVLGDL
jgi:hypothetical protein